MDNILVTKYNEVKANHTGGYKDYEYYKRDMTKDGISKQCEVFVYEIPPLKSAYPYHYHIQKEETFYIISGKGILRTPLGDKLVSAGDFIFCKAGEDGAHKLTNSSDSEMLVYLDFDTKNTIDVTIYPDSEKIAIWGDGTNKIFRVNDSTDYYHSE